MLGIGCSSSQNQSEKWVQTPALKGKYIVAKMFKDNYPDCTLNDSIIFPISDTINAERTPYVDSMIHTEAKIFFTISQQDTIHCLLASVDGKIISKVFTKEFYPGKYILNFSNSRIQPGMYFVAIKFGDSIIKKRTIIFN